MAQNRRSDFVHGTDVTLEVYVDGTGPALVVLPSYGRDGGADFDDFAKQGGRGWLHGPASSASRHCRLKRKYGRVNAA